MGHVCTFQPHLHLTARALLFLTILGHQWEMSIWHNHTETKQCLGHPHLAVTIKLSEHKSSPIPRRGATVAWPGAGSRKISFQGTLLCQRLNTQTVPCQHPGQLSTHWALPTKCCPPSRANSCNHQSDSLPNPHHPPSLLSLHLPKQSLPPPPRNTSVSSTWYFIAL